MIFDSLLENTRGVSNNIPPELDNIEECFGDPYEYTISIVYENMIMCNILEQEILANSYNELKESGYIVNEANILSSFFKGLLSILHKLWEKICAFFKKIFGIFKKDSKDNKEFVKEHEKHKVSNQAPKTPQEINQLKNKEEAKAKNKPTEWKENGKTYVDAVAYFDKMEEKLPNLESPKYMDMSQYSKVAKSHIDILEKNIKDRINDIPKMNAWDIDKVNAYIERLFPYRLICPGYDSTKSMEANYYSVYRSSEKITYKQTDKDMFLKVIDDENQTISTINQMFNNTKKFFEDMKKQINQMEKDAEKLHNKPEVIRAVGAIIPKSVNLLSIENSTITKVISEQIKLYKKFVKAIDDYDNYFLDLMDSDKVLVF